MGLAVPPPYGVNILTQTFGNHPNNRPVLGVTVQSRLHIEFSLNMSKSEQTMSSAPPMEYAQTPQSVPPSYSEAIAQPYPQPVMHQPPPMGFAPPQGAPAAGFHHQMPGGMPNTIITTIVPVGPASTHTNCPHCHAEINTTVVSTPSIWAYVSGAAIALIGCWLGCCLIPCCIDDCMDKRHSCPNCKGHVGMFRRYGTRRF